MSKKTSAKIRKFRIDNIEKAIVIKKQEFPKNAYYKEALLRNAKIFLDLFTVQEPVKMLQDA